jgi:GNAT superfamily N-acetyltransferase
MTVAVEPLSVEPLSADNVEALIGLFDAAGCACFCRYFHFGGSKNEWLDRLAHDPLEGARELRASVASAPSLPGGLVASARSSGSDEAVGWAKVVPLASVPKLRLQGAYRPLDLGDEATTLVVGCLLVHPAHRNSGVARALVRAAQASAATNGASRLLGLPRRSALPLYDEEAFAGPERVYEELGFRVLHASPAYPVYAFDP